jgi:hypothetical protein
MALNDFVFRIKPTAGHTVPTDLVTNTAVLGTVGGSPSTTITKFDKGGGLFAWRFLNGIVSGAVPTAISTLNLNNGSGDAGATLVIRGRILTDGFSISDVCLFQVGTSTSRFEGLSVTRTSATETSCNYGGVSTGAGPDPNDLRNYVVRILPNASGDNDHIESWHTTPGRVGTAPNLAPTQTLRSGTALTTLLVYPGGNGYEIELEDVVFYRGAKTNAECALLADTANLDTILVTDTTPPTLTSPTGTQTGTTTASGTVSTNEGNGTLYRRASTNATETVATVKAAALTTTVTATGTQSVAFTGLTAATTYFAHYVHTDAAGNDSTRVSSSSFTTATAATGVTMTGPTAGVNGVASTNFTVGVTPGGSAITGTVVVTPSSGGGGGTFTPTTISLTTGSPSGTFTYTPASTGAKTISVTNNGSLSNPSNITYTVSAAGDVTPPTLTGTVASSLVTASTATISWPTGADNTAVTSYEYRLNGGAYTDVGNVTTTNLTSLSPSTLYNVGVRAKDAAGNVSTPEITGSFTTIAGSVAPTITVQPLPATVTEGAAAGFSVTATGTATLTYQWRKNGSNISGATSATYTTPATILADNGAQYSVVVTNGVGSATSNNALLTVNPVIVSGAMLIPIGVTLNGEVVLL